MGLTLTSPAFAAQGRIPTRYTCDGSDVSPPLHWSGAPAETRSFALICADPDAPAGTWHHWAIFDIPATADGLPEHQKADASGVQQALNDFDRKGYGGPCPPGNGAHHYHFTLYALKVEHLPVPTTARCRDVARAAKAHVLAQADLVGLYGH